MTNFFSIFNGDISSLESKINIILAVSTIIFTIYNFFKQSIIDRKENKLIKEREITILKQKIADLDLTDTKAIKEYKRSYFFPRTKKDELSPDAIETIELIDDIYKNQFIDSIQYFIF